SSSERGWAILEPLSPVRPTAVARRCRQYFWFIPYGRRGPYLWARDRSVLAVWPARRSDRSLAGQNTATLRRPSAMDVSRRRALASMALAATASTLPAGRAGAAGNGDDSEPLAAPRGVAPETLARDEDFWGRVAGQFKVNRDFVNLE